MRVRFEIAALVLLAGLAVGAPAVPAQEGAPPVQERQRSRLHWSEQAEQSFRLGPGMGRKLMTEEEWGEHRDKMRAMSPEERDLYRREFHQKMMERAKEKGLSLPQMPGPGGPREGSGMGGGRGPAMGGRGHGGGGGRGR